MAEKTATATPKAEAKEAKAKVFSFTSSNPYLTVASLGVQFIEGKATTTSVEVARALAKIDGVEVDE